MPFKDAVLPLVVVAGMIGSSGFNVVEVFEDEFPAPLVEPAVLPLVVFELVVLGFAAIVPLYVTVLDWP